MNHSQLFSESVQEYMCVGNSVSGDVSHTFSLVVLLV